MASKAELDRVSVLRARIARARKQRSRNMEEWAENARYYLDGTGAEQLVGDNDHEVVINKVFSSLRAQLPALSLSRPKWEVVPRRKKVVNGENIAPRLAASREHLLNYWWRELDVQFQLRLCILSAKLAFGALKVGYTPDFIDNPKAGKFKEDEAGNLTIGGNGLPELERGDYMRDEDGLPIIDPDSGLPLLEPGEILLNEKFFVKWVKWDRFLFDPEGENDFGGHAWIAEEWCRPTQELKEDTLLNSNRKHLKPTEQVGESDDGDMLGAEESPEPSQGSAVRDDEARTRGYTIYDLRKRTIEVIAESSKGGDAHECLLRSDPMPPEQEHGPYLFLRLNEVPGRWEPQPDVTLMRSPQDEINILRSKLLTHVSRADRKYGYDENAFENENDLEQMQGGGDMTMVKMTDPNGMWPIPQAPMDSAIFAAAVDMDKSFDEVAGQAAETRGVAKSETATQASILEGRGQVRESDQRDLIVDFVSRAGRKLDQTLSVNMSQEVWVSVGDQTRPYPYPQGDAGMSVAPSDLQLEADISIEIGSMAPKTDAMKRQQTMQLLEILVKGGPLLLSSPALLEALFEMWELHNTEAAEQLVATARQMVEAQQGQQQGGITPGSLPSTVGGQANPAPGV